MATQTLFSTSYGLMSLFTILFVIVIGVCLFRFVMRNMEEDARKAMSAENASKMADGSQ